MCRHLLLMSATPHNGKEEDFQLFMALLDGDRFEGRFRDGIHYADTADMMRRLTKEELRRFDGRPLFPERRAYTVKYQLSPKEAALYSAVTDYVRTEMNRVQRFAEGDNKKRNNVGFALQILQRRLASSPAAIYQSLKRRRERLESELAEARLAVHGRQTGLGCQSALNIDPLSAFKINPCEACWHAHSPQLSWSGLLDGASVEAFIQRSLAPIRASREAARQLLKEARL